MSTRTFQTTVIAAAGKVFIAIPFDPDKVWGVRERHHITGMINDCKIRGQLVRNASGDGYMWALGPAWRRDNKIEVGQKVRVTLAPEGPRQENSAPDVAATFAAAPETVPFFESLPTFYRNNYMRWIDSAKRPETRASRIAEMIALLKAGKRER
ncbi:MAG TPA: YdeI/OmpD-associated family protein [Anaerolineae bacterium]